MSNKLDELLEIARHKTKKPIKKQKLGEVQKFITEFEVKPGTQKVPPSIIYMYYEDWRPQSKTKLSKVKFFLEFSKHFEKTVDGYNRTFYLLEEGIFDTSLEMRQRAATRVNNEKEKTKKKNNKKK